MKSRDVSLAKMIPTVLFPAPGIPIKTMFDLSSHILWTAHLFSGFEHEY
jgi:hypothetical protein